MNAPPRRVLIAPDKFKGTLSAEAAARAIESGFQRAWPETQFTRLPLADGGEGFTQCLANALGGRMHSCATIDALGRACSAEWAALDHGVGALDIASASGLAAIALAERDPLVTSTRGTGRVLRAMAATGIKQVMFGLGGSATNDAGIGIAAELGFGFFDARGQEVELNGRGLGTVARVTRPQQPSPLRFVIATDVDNPLFGPHGAAHQFAAQKGASEADVQTLDDNLRHFAAIVAGADAEGLATRPGAGAAGGVGFCMMALFAAERRSGFDVLAELLRLPQLVDEHDLIVTGEGSFDRTSLAGKAPLRLAMLARERGRPVWGLFGRCDAPQVHEYFERHALSDSSRLRTVSEHVEHLSLRAFELARGITQ